MGAQSALMYQLWNSGASLDKHGDINTYDSGMAKNVHWTMLDRISTEIKRNHTWYNGQTSTFPFP